MRARRGAGSLPKGLLESEGLGTLLRGFMPSPGRMDPCQLALPRDTERPGTCQVVWGREGLEGVCKPAIWVYGCQHLQDTGREGKRGGEWATMEIACKREQLLCSTSPVLPCGPSVA